MKKYLLIIFLMVFAQSALFPGCTRNAAPEEEKQTELLISAAASLTDVMEELKVIFERENKGFTLTMNYGSSGALRQQIEHGAPADLFISAAKEQMDALEERELIIPESRLNILENSLVLIAPQSVTPGSGFESLLSAGVRKIGLGDPGSVPAGQYAQEVLTYLNLWDALENKFVLGKDVRQVLTWVETGNVDAGFVYLTDALAAEVNKIAEAPPGSHTPIVYPAAIIAGTEQKEAASGFLAFLTSREAKEIFQKHGFKTVAGK